MKRFFLVIYLLSITVYGAIAQNTAGLEVRKFDTNSSIFIPEGSKIQVIKDHKRYKGTLKVISDQSILIDSDTILINQIQLLNAKTFSSKLGGGILVAAGSFFGGLGVAGVGSALLSADSYAILGIVFAPLGVLGIIGVIKGVKLISRGRKFNPSDWEYRVITSAPQQVSK